MTPTGWLRWYYAKRDSFGPPALDLVDSTGRLYRKTCSKCRSKVRHFKASENCWVCGRCGTPWPYVDRYMLKGAVDSSPRSRYFDERHSRYFDIGKALARLLNGPEGWNMMLYVANALGHSERNLERHFWNAYPDAPGPLSRSEINRRIRAAKSRWAEELERMGLA